MVPKASTSSFLLLGKKISEYFGCPFKEISANDVGGVEECIIDILKEVRAYESGYIGNSQKPFF